MREYFRIGRERESGGKWREMEGERVGEDKYKEKGYRGYIFGGEG